MILTTYRYLLYNLHTCTHQDGHDEVGDYYFGKESRGEAWVRGVHRLPHFAAEKKEQRIRAKAAGQAR